MVTDAPNHQPNITGATAANEHVASVEEDSIGDDERNCSIAEWQPFLPNSTLGDEPPSASTDKGKIDPFRSTVASARSPMSVSEGDEKPTTCFCLKRLTDRLCHLNIIERKQNMIRLDMTLSETDTTLSCAEIALECHFCRLDSKVILLIMTVLQTVLNWVIVEYKQKIQGRELPPIHFGDWKLSVADGNLIKVQLTNRILATSDSVVSTLRLRMDEIKLKASRQNLGYGFMDSEHLQHMLHRLTASLKELAECIKC